MASWLAGEGSIGRSNEYEFAPSSAAECVVLGSRPDRSQIWRRGSRLGARSIPLGTADADIHAGRVMHDRVSLGRRKTGHGDESVIDVYGVGVKQWPRRVPRTCETSPITCGAEQPNGP
jgi:hypothetical protein